MGRRGRRSDPDTALGSSFKEHGLGFPSPCRNRKENVQQADYDSDGKSDITVYRPSEGRRYTVKSSTGDWTSTQWGAGDDIPVARDYDGDGKTDIAIYR